jgi:ATP-dependent DNA helicase PIF1
MTLNAEQKAAVAAVRSGINIFLTGAGGTGKSHTIRSIVSWAALVGKQVAVTAMTGCAALLLNYDQKAKTLHSWAGVGLGRESPQELAEAIIKKRAALKRWKTTQILIIDEISMMQPELLEKLDLVARRVRKEPTKRFGGIQLVLAGDFCQLPPVSSKATTFVFESALWAELIDETHNLTQIVRQSDTEFQKILNQARMGALSDESLAVLQARVGLPWQDNEIKPTLIYSKNAHVDRINKENMASLTGEQRFYESKTVVREKPTVSSSDPKIEAELSRMDADASYEANLELRVGAQVMLIVNLDQERGLVNGSRGIVTGYSPGGLPLVRFLGRTDPEIIDRHNWWLSEPNECIGRAQIPLRVAYAITIHKSQGATLDSALIDIGSSTFEYGQAYVALSRCRSLESLYIFKLDRMKILCHPKVREFYETMASVSVSDSADRPPSILDSLSPAWREIIDPFPLPIDESLSPYFPEATDIFAALKAGDPAAIRVVIVGQDPYPTPGNAHGLAFSVRPTVTKLPPSLQNIFKELATDIESDKKPENGCLQPWVDQGVLLLNDVLTVEPGRPLSHVGRGWEQITTAILAAVLREAVHVVVIIWGRNAQKKLDAASIKPLLAKHTVLTAPHPSPLSAHTGFFGSRPFSKTNEALIAHGQAPIQWIS